MVEIRLQIPDELVEKLQGQLGNQTKATDMAREAMTLFNWAVEEKANGRVILSSSRNGEDMTKLAMPVLDSAASRALRRQS